MTSLSPWSLLTDAEQRILLPKLLLPGSSNEVEGEARISGGEIFDKAMLDEAERLAPDETQVAERLLTLRNFMTQTGAGSANGLWQHVELLKGVRRSYLELRVWDRDRLIRALVDIGFVVNREPFWTIHRFDSAREVTTFSDEPSLHFANDRADEPAYGANYFFVHWDVSSAWFKETRRGRGLMARVKVIERLRSAWRHRTGFAEPEAVHSSLMARLTPQTGEDEQIARSR